VAIFGTSSETYRTCGHPGCHCHGAGPKHGPHLQVSYRGEQGKTTGYYVPKGGRAGHAARSSRLAETAAVFEGAGRVEQATQFPARPRGRLAMRQWLCRVLAGLGACLLLGLAHAEAGRGVHTRPRIAYWGRSAGAWGEPVLASPTAVPTKSRELRQVPAALFESLAFASMLLTEPEVLPLGQDSRGPPGKAPGTRDDPGLADQTGSPRQGCASCLRAHHPPGPGTTPKKGFCNRL
jgi:hypothetical protein